MILNPSLTRIAIIDTASGEEIAVITNEEITTASDEIVVVLTPEHN